MIVICVLIILLESSDSDQICSRHYHSESEIQKKKQTKAETVSKPKTSFVKAASNEKKSEFDICTHIRPVSYITKADIDSKIEYLVPKKVDPNEDKPQYWDVLGEHEVFARLNRFAIEYQSALETDIVKIELEKCKNLLLQSKQNRKIFLFPQLLIKEKKQRSVAPAPGPENMENKVNELQPRLSQDLQEWKINKAGFIYSSSFPYICLTLNSTVRVQLEIHLKRPSDNKDDANDVQNLQEIVKNGYAIILSSRQLNDENDYRDKNKQWCLSKYGTIYSKVCFLYNSC